MEYEFNDETLIVEFADGTPYEPPEDPLLYDPKFRKQEQWAYDCESWGYECMNCSKCPLGVGYQFSEEELKAREKFKKALRKYDEENKKLHGEVYFRPKFKGNKRYENE